MSLPLSCSCRASPLSFLPLPPKFQSLPVENHLPSSQFKPIRKTIGISNPNPLSSKTHVQNRQSQIPKTLFGARIKNSDLKSHALIQFGIFWCSVQLPALAVTGTVEEDLVWNLISGGIVAFVYLIIMPPVILNWLRQRWYKRKFLEMYLQFMFVFLFFPGILLWAPFVNFRRFPRDPTMKYPWSTPQDPSVNDPPS